MKIPEPLFKFINPVVRILLNSPIHFLLSKSLMLITFTGRNSGRRFTTPVRYVREDKIVRCFTSAGNQWWRNLRGGANVVLRIEGKNASYHATSVENNPTEVKKWLMFYLAKYPQDASYHDIRIDQDKSLSMEDLEAASKHTIVVEARPLY